MLTRVDGTDPMPVRSVAPRMKVAACSAIARSASVGGGSSIANGASPTRRAGRSGRRGGRGGDRAAARTWSGKRSETSTTQRRSGSSPARRSSGIEAPACSERLHQPSASGGAAAVVITRGTTRGAAQNGESRRARTRRWRPGRGALARSGRRSRRAWTSGCWRTFGLTSSAVDAQVLRRRARRARRTRPRAGPSPAGLRCCRGARPGPRLGGRQRLGHRRTLSRAAERRRGSAGGWSLRLSSSSSADSPRPTTRPRPTRGRRRARVLGRLHRHVVVDPGGHPAFEADRVTAGLKCSASATFTQALSVLADDDHGAVLVDLLHRLGGVLLGAGHGAGDVADRPAIPRRAGGRAGSGRCPSWCGPRRRRWSPCRSHAPTAATRAGAQTPGDRSARAVFVGCYSEAPLRRPLGLSA